MKKINSIKILQLVVLAALTIAALALAFINQEALKELASKPLVLGIYILIWLVLILSFIFLYLDFHRLSKLQMEFDTLSKATFSDNISGIPNRFSCDILLDKYKNLGAPKSAACAMIVLTSLSDVNNRYGHDIGDEHIKAFSDVFTRCAASLCFAGRNGGDKFLAIFEDTSETAVPDFLELLKSEIEKHNTLSESSVIEYRYGVAENTHEHYENIIDLITLANKRIYE